VRKLAAPHRLVGYEAPLKEFEAFWREHRSSAGASNEKRAQKPAKKPARRPRTGSGKGRRG
jgi:hypothetical protein